MSTIEIDVDVRNNTVICGVNGGNGRGYPGTRIVWRAANEKLTFSLEFFRLAVEAGRKPVDVRELPRWPFVEPEPPRDVVPPTREFTGTLRDDAPAQYKYSVTVDNLRLDPIIIVDKK
jgi:hypothetical protein